MTTISTEAVARASSRCPSGAGKGGAEPAASAAAAAGAPGLSSTANTGGSRLRGLASVACVAGFALLALLLAACGGDSGTEDGHDDHAAAGSWTITAWGDHYEVFPEAPPLAVGETATAHVHVTVLDAFTPLADGRVELVLRPEAGSGREEVFAAGDGDTAGIFPVELTPAAAGERRLVFRVTGPAGREEIAGGVVRVGSGGEAGRLLRAPAPRGASTAAEPVAFTKEQQWQADFATDWVRRGRFADSARGLAELEAPAGGDVTVTAPVDAVIVNSMRPSTWPYPGLAVDAGAPLFRLLPRVSESRSLAELGAEAEGLAAELEAATARRRRLDGLLEVEAVSRREVEEARAREESLTARLEAARRDLASARSARQGGGGGETVTVTSPLAGRVAAVTVSPGEAVSAGQTLARVVRVDPVWVRVSLSPADARRLAAAAAGGQEGPGGLAGLVLDGGDGPPLELPADRVRLVSVAPSVEAGSGRVPALVEVSGGVGLTLGTAVDAEILLPGHRDGVVVPTTALVDDGGRAVVYLQLAGERFVRQEITVLTRRGDRALVEGLRPGQRLVTRGGDAIRRATLMATGGGHGHVH